ncbi:ABC transporter ATP-binding protein [Marinobacter sp. X15-166B]|uniref:ABC transporter ATP-binding protein n=1 Tax=Marinobacter sp. X15-166B TaxID=1897620 RepID=UPI00085C08F4|nr:ABC transporter ATP-binding protein [Marinobacter sp. X15-166B]OEY67045.1 ABC transporter ATP-binding protein [Marinobacter sp. X15-166B]
MKQSKKLGIEISDVHLSFGKTKVLKGVNLSIEPGEFFAFLGPSGSGKSTLLRAIAGFGPAPVGRIEIGGRDITKLPPWERNVGMVFQSYALWPHLSVRDNVAFGLVEKKMPKKQINEKVDAALELVGLLDFHARMPSQLSGGQQQRVALARTVAIEPDVLLLDEPLSNLDANLRVQMRREILRLQRTLGLTTIFVTHDQEEANTTSDRMALLDQGIVQQVGTPQHLYDHPENLFVAKFLGTANIIAGEVSVENGAHIMTLKSGEKVSLHATQPGPGNLVLRPQNISLSEQITPGMMVGKIAHREFLGAQVRYLIDAAGTQLVVDQSHSADGKLLQDGSEIGLVINSKSSVFLHDAGPGGMKPRPRVGAAVTG